ncbi:MAG TPA: carboxypeptidase M32 [Gemmatimonadales bacterium]|nr:carboxypeptidase M32 [Gemmatimonadales bacterium]
MAKISPKAAYDELIRLSREEAVLVSAIDVLEWDEETCLPRGGVEHRGEQLAMLAGLLHDRSTDPRVAELLDALEGSALVADPESPAAVNVRELRRGYERERRLPRRLVAETARVTSLAQQAWADARESADYERFRPWLERQLALAREEADAVGYPETPYDALLEDYEPGLTTRQLAALFADLRRELVPLVQALAESNRRGRTSVLRREYPLDRQRIFAEAVASTVGFDLDRGRLDTSIHPFCTALGPGDCRITARFAPRDFAAGFFTMLHEVGHALYEQGLDVAHYGTPMGEPASVGLHESQSRLWENLVGRRRAFWEHFFPRARGTFHEALHDVTLDAWVAALTRVERSLIRVEADEVTYNLHILIRFELEQALLAGDLPACDLPEAWAAAYRELLGIAPANDREGCLQDGHWAEGLIGYFPTYTLGNIYAAQLFAAARAALGDLDAAFARGDFSPLRDWLREQVHRQGQRYTAAGLIQRITGGPPDWRPMIESLRARYGEQRGA